MFCQNLGGAARNWFNDLDPKIVNNFEELSQKFLEEFSQQKRYAKDLTKIHGIKRRQNEGLQAFMDWFKFESSHIKGVPPVIRISAFMYGHGHLELAKKLSNKIPKMVDEMFKKFSALGWHLEEIHMTWAHLEKKQMRLRTCTKIHQEVLFSERGDDVTSIKRRRHDLSGDGVWILVMASQRSRLKVDLEPSMWQRRQEHKATPLRRYVYIYRTDFRILVCNFWG
ncbi:reverse transcriptase domain-containing protein [Tanacetum coccineum]